MNKLPLALLVAVALAAAVLLLLALGDRALPDDEPVVDAGTAAGATSSTSTSSTSTSTSTTSTTVPPTTTTTAVARTAPTVRAAAAAPPVTVAPTGGERRSTSSTMYCQGTTMANGQHVHVGAVSSKVLPRGSRWRVLSGPKVGQVFTVEDTGSKAYFDMYTPSCEEAIQYGRRNIEIEVAA